MWKILQDQKTLLHYMMFFQRELTIFQQFKILYFWRLEKNSYNNFRTNSLIIMRCIFSLVCRLRIASCAPIEKPACYSVRVATCVPARAVQHSWRNAFSVELRYSTWYRCPSVAEAEVMLLTLNRGVMPQVHQDSPSQFLIIHNRSFIASEI